MIPQPSSAMAQMLARMLEEDGQLPDATTLPPAEGRAQTERVHARWGIALPEVALVENFFSPDADGGRMRCRRIVPRQYAGSGAILFLHGGGWAFCSIDTHEDHMRRLANASGMAVFACDYRLAPEHPFPAGLRDCVAFWRALEAGDLPGSSDAGPVVIAGDSAGANLALAAVLSELAEGRATPDAALLLYGAFGVDFDTRSYRDHADGPGLTRDKMRRFWDWYCAKRDRNDYRAAPLAATNDLLRALPPLVVFAAEVDPLRTDSELLVSRLNGIGRPDRLHLLPGMTHGALQMGAWLSDTRVAIDRIGKLLRQVVDGA